MENKKGLIITIAVVAVILLGAIGYYFYAKANADVSQDSVCRSLTGNAWRNCAINAKKWQLFLRDTSETNFVKVLEGMKTGAGIVTPTKTKPSQKVTLTANPTTINVGETSTISWIVENITSCKPNDGDGSKVWGLETFKTNSSYVATPTVNTSFSIDCTGTDGKTASYTAMVTVNKGVDPIVETGATLKLIDESNNPISGASISAHIYAGASYGDKVYYAPEIVSGISDSNGSYTIKDDQFTAIKNNQDFVDTNFPPSLCETNLGSIGDSYFIVYEVDYNNTTYIVNTGDISLGLRYANPNANNINFELTGDENQCSDYNLLYSLDYTIGVPQTKTFTVS